MCLEGREISQAKRKKKKGGILNENYNVALSLNNGRFQLLLDRYTLSLSSSAVLTKIKKKMHFYNTCTFCIFSAEYTA